MNVLLELAGLISIAILVGLNGFFVAAEFSLVTVRWTRIEQIVSEGKFRASAVRHAIEKLDDSIAATQLGITFASLGLGWLGEPALAHLIEPAFERLPGVWSAAATHAVAVAAAFLIITYLHVVLGELAPKAIALQRAEQVALFVAAPLLVFGRVFRPFIQLMNGSGNRVVRLLRLPPLPQSAHVHSVDELRMLVEETEEAGVIPEDQAIYVQNVFRLSDKRVRDVMVPRDKVVTLSLNSTPEQILETARASAHTRMPVWQDQPENLVGIVNTKNLFHIFSEKGLVILADAMYPPLFVHPDLGVARLLRIFRRERRPMAIVRDHDGNFLGIVTLEDILEEIVGEIEDEHDEPQRAKREARSDLQPPGPTRPDSATGART